MGLGLGEFGEQERETDDMAGLDATSRRKRSLSRLVFSGEDVMVDGADEGHESVARDSARERLRLVLMLLGLN